MYCKIFGCAGSSLLLGLFPSCGEQELLSSCDVPASYCGGFSCCGAWALGCLGFSSCSRAEAQYLWCTGLVAPWHVESS